MFSIVCHYLPVSVLFKPLCFSFWLQVHLSSSVFVPALFFLSPVLASSASVTFCFCYFSVSSYRRTFLSLYAGLFSALAEGSGLDEETLYDLFMDGLAGNIRDAVLFAELPLTLYQVIQLAVQFESFLHDNQAETEHSSLGPVSCAYPGLASCSSSLKGSSEAPQAPEALQVSEGHHVSYDPCLAGGPWSVRGPGPLQASFSPDFCLSVPPLDRLISGRSLFLGCQSRGHLLLLGLQSRNRLLLLGHLSCHLRQFWRGRTQTLTTRLSPQAHWVVLSSPQARWVVLSSP